MTASDYMDGVVRDLRESYVMGGVKIALNPDQLAEWDTLGLYDNSALDAVESNYAQIGQFITQLDGDLRQAVISGKNAAGNPYTIERWAGFAQDVAGDIQAQTGYAWDASYIASIPSSLALAAVSTWHKITSPSSWPWYVWAGLGTIFTFGVVLPAFRYSAEASRNVKGSIRELRG